MPISKNVLPVLINNPQATGSNLYTDGDYKVVVDTNGITFTGDRTSGSATLANVTVPTGLTVGMFLVGTGIPPNTYITAIGATSITMSANASSGSGTSTTVTVQSEVLRYKTADVVEKVALPGAAVSETLQVTDVSYTAANNTQYSFNIIQQPNPLQEPFQPQQISFLSDSSATATEIANGLAAEINTLAAAGKLRCTAVAVPASNKITITAQAGFPIFVVTSTLNVTANTTTAGVAAVGTGAQILAKFPPANAAGQVFGFNYDSIGGLAPVVGTTYSQCYISVKVQPSMPSVAADLATQTFYYIVKSGTNAAACVSDLTA